MVLAPGPVAAPAGRATADPRGPVVIAGDRCKACELCLGVCPHGSLALDPGAVNPLGYHPVRLVDAGSCTSCALCARVCPDAVFTVYAPRRAG